MYRDVQTYLYEDYDEDMVFSHQQDYVLPSDYQWVAKRPLAKAYSSALYSFAYVIGRVYLWATLRWRVQGTNALKHSGPKGMILFCNHTQPIGDVLAPAYAVHPRRIYTLASPANLGIPVIGKLLKSLGALPVPEERRRLKELKEAIAVRLQQDACIVIYPEAHVWPYCTFIRPFSPTSFAFAVDNSVPAYALTTTYRKRPHGNKPQAVAYLDGPFFVEEGIPKPQARKLLCEQVTSCMKRRSESSSYEYVRYEQTRCE